MLIVKRSAALLLAVLASLVVSACSTPPSEAEGAEVSVTVAASQALASEDVVAVQVEVSGPGLATAMVFDLSRTADGWGGTLSGIPAGQRHFEARGLDADGAVVYQGRAGPVAVRGGGTAAVVLVLQPVQRPPRYANAAPVIDALVVSASQVDPGGSVTLTLSASDPDGEALTYAWSARSGTFSSAGAPSTSWSAPQTEGEALLTAVVTDPKGQSARLQVALTVAPRRNTGSAQVTAVLSTWPSVTGMTASPSRVVEYQPVVLTASAMDLDGDALSYSWTSENCWGYFNNPYAARTEFYPYYSWSGTCSFTVQVADGRGGFNSGTLVLATGPGPRANFAPEVLSTTQSAEVAAAHEVVSFGLSAQDADGSLLRFSWSAAEGVFLSQADDAGASTAQWKAPGCMSGPKEVVATVTDASGLATSHTFTVGARETQECSANAVTGTRLFHHVLQDGSEVTRAADPAQGVPDALVARPDGSGYDTLAGEAHADGSFVIHEVPAGEYFLKVGTVYYLQSARSVDLGQMVLGRPVSSRASPGTRLNLALTGLTPWTSSDDVQLVVPNAGLGYFVPACAAVGSYPAEGATSWSMELDWQGTTACGGNGELVDAAQGDSGWVTQLSSRTLGEWSIAEMRHLAPLSFTLADGAVTEVSAALAPGELNDGVTVDFRTTRFEALAAAAHPGAALGSYTGWSFGAQPTSAGYGANSGWPDLALASTYTPGQPDSLERVSFTNPYPSHWLRTAVGSAYARVPVTQVLADGTRSRARSVLVGASALETVDGADVLLDPAISPPRAVTVSGLSTETHREAVGTHPLLAWAAPEDGSPSRYFVRVYSLTGGSATAAPTRRLVGTVHTDRTSVLLPFALQAGVTYYAVVTAEWQPGWTFARPLARHARAHLASAVTQTFRP